MIRTLPNYDPELVDIILGMGCTVIIESYFPDESDDMIDNEHASILIENAYVTNASTIPKIVSKCKISKLRISIDFNPNEDSIEIPDEVQLVCINSDHLNCFSKVKKLRIESECIGGIYCSGIISEKVLDRLRVEDLSWNFRSASIEIDLTNIMRVPNIRLECRYIGDENVEQLTITGLDQCRCQWIKFECPAGNIFLSNYDEIIEIVRENALRCRGARTKAIPSD